MTGTYALAGARIFDGRCWHDDSALLVRDGFIDGIAPVGSVTDRPTRIVSGGVLAPGFIDLQVNGGGGALLNDEPTLQSIRTICSTYARFGTTALLPTLITDTRETTARTVAAGIEATEANVPGFLGLHLEGPHLSVARKGAHDPALIRPMDEADLEALIAARRHLPNLLTTVAAETVDPQQIARLTGAGIIVSIGHSDADFATVAAAARAGATVATHLFNAMSQIGNREPGVVGAVLETGSLFAGLIADGIHVHPVSIDLALRAKVGPGRIFLVTDAMSMTGTDLKTITLNGRTIHRADGALRLADGTLAGADLTMIDAVTFMHRQVGLPLEEALRMPSTYPAEAMGLGAEHGHLEIGAIADFIHLSDDLTVKGTWIRGDQVFSV